MTHKPTWIAPKWIAPDWGTTHLRHTIYYDF